MEAKSTRKSRFKRQETIRDNLGFRVEFLGLEVEGSDVIACVIPWGPPVSYRKREERGSIGMLLGWLSAARAIGKTRARPSSYGF